MGIEITNIKIAVSGKDILFSNLSINQYLADVNSFSFTWRVPKDTNKDSYSEYVDFYDKNLSKEVVVTIGGNNATNFTFKGFIHSISCTGKDDTATEYNISGKGNIAKLDEIEECNTYYKKSISDIVSDVLKNVDYMSQPETTTDLFYTVQYNQTKFDFLRLLAIRYGEWMYYDGQQLIIGPKFGNSLSVQIQKDISDVNISSKIFKPSGKNIGFNTYEGKPVEKDGNDSPGIDEKMIKASAKAGDSTYGNSQTFTHSHAVVTGKTSFNNNIKDVVENQMHGYYSNAMYLTARSGNSKISLGSTLSINDENNKSMGKYIVIQINHFCSSDSQYQNSFVAVPSAIKKPPYTNPNLYPPSKAQPAIVADNEDDKQLGRIKVHFPWQQQNENTPWLPVMVPHAGKNKGFHFLPEKDEQVMIDFIGNNAERPYVIGAFYAESNEHGNDHTGNNIKVIGTRSGRRLMFNDDQGWIHLTDNADDENHSTKDPNNFFAMQNSEGSQFTSITSEKDENNYSWIQFQNGESLELALNSNGEKICDLRFSSDGKKITIHSKGSIEISADQQIDINSGTININASQELNLKGKQTGINLEGKDINALADMNMNLSAKSKMNISSEATMEVGATASAKIDGGATTTIKGGMVMIN